jgi:hypothetical protein
MFFLCKKAPTCSPFHLTLTNPYSPSSTFFFSFFALFFFWLNSIYQRSWKELGLPHPQTSLGTCNALLPGSWNKPARPQQHSAGAGRSTVFKNRSKTEGEKMDVCKKMDKINKMISKTKKNNTKK